MTKQITEVIGEYYHHELELPITRARFCYTLAPKAIVQPENPHAGRTFFLNPRITNLQRKPELSSKEERILAILQALQPYDQAVFASLQAKDIFDQFGLTHEVWNIPVSDSRF